MHFRLEPCYETGGALKSQMRGEDRHVGWEIYTPAVIMLISFRVITMFLIIRSATPSQGI